MDFAIKSIRVVTFEDGEEWINTNDLRRQLDLNDHLTAEEVIDEIDDDRNLNRKEAFITIT